jgi:hypothetical protein
LNDGDELTCLIEEKVNAKKEQKKSKQATKERKTSKPNEKEI